MALAKLAQNVSDLEQFDDLIEGLGDSWEDGNDLSLNDDSLMVEELDAKDTTTTTETTETPTDETKGEVLIEVDGEPVESYEFSMPFVPGADKQDNLEELVVEEEPEEIKVEDDPWHWGDLKNVPKWMHDRYQAIPRHSGYDISGLERAIAYLKTFLRQVSKATQSDINGVLDVNQVETVRDQVEDGISRLEERIDRLESHKKKNRKRSSEENESLVKTAQKITGLSNGITVTVPLLISRLARIMINGTVSAGHDMEDMFHKLSEDYDLSKREQAELIQLIEDMGYPVRMDRGIVPMRDNKDYHNQPHFDWNQNFLS